MVLSIAMLATAACVTVAEPPPTPSANLAIELDVKPAQDFPGQYIVSSKITDLETNVVIAKPLIRVGSNKPARIEMGSSDKWHLAINVTTDDAARKVAYDAQYKKDGKVVSQQRIAVNL